MSDRCLGSSLQCKYIKCSDEQWGIASFRRIIRSGRELEGAKTGDSKLESLVIFAKLGVLSETELENVLNAQDAAERGA